MAFYETLKLLMSTINEVVSVQMAVFSIQLCAFFSTSVTAFLTPGKMAIYFVVFLMVEMAVFLIITSNGTENVNY